MNKDSTNHSFGKAGEIYLQEVQGKLKFYAYVHEHKEPRCIGSLIGAVYEKTCPILRQPEPSFCLPLSELAAVEEAGGQFIRFIARGEASGTYSISAADFRAYGEKYFARGYGSQLRVPLTCPRFAHSSKAGKRNPIVDNPVIEQTAEIVKQKDKQTSFFDRWMK